MEIETREMLGEKVGYIIPIVIVIILASFLALSTSLAQVVITATFYVEEGSSSDQAKAAGMNALIFLIPAIIGGFGLALLFKYRKKVTLKMFFGGAILFAGTFIAYFFGAVMLELIRERTGSLIMTTEWFGTRSGESLFGYLADPNFDYLLILASLICGTFTCYILLSGRFTSQTKNILLLAVGGFMGAFLSIILPTWTVFFMLISLSLYDIYSVFHGPIRQIHEMTMEEERQRDRKRRHRQEEARREYQRQKEAHIRQERRAPPPAVPLALEIRDPSSVKEGRAPPKALPVAKEISPDEKGQGRRPGAGIFLIRTRRGRLLKRMSKLTESTNEDPADFLLSAMTYSGGEWDLGIGDLVFYSLLASHVFSPQFMYSNFVGSAVFEGFGYWGLWAIFICASIGIIGGFFGTMHLLKKNHMLPGLPISIFLGCAGFLIPTAIMYFA